MRKEDMESIIIKYEWEMTEAVMKGHRPHMGDMFKEKRQEVKRLRELIKHMVKSKVNDNSIPN